MGQMIEDGILKQKDIYKIQSLKSFKENRVKMISMFKLIWDLFNLVCNAILILFMLWSFWYGVKVESGGLIIELYGIGRYFK